MKKRTFFIASMIACLSLVGCAKEAPPSVYGNKEVGALNKVHQGIILSKRKVQIDTVANTESNNEEVTVGSNNVRKNGFRHQPGFEYVIQLEDGKTVSVVQTENMKFKVNQRVFVIYGASTTRIVADKSS